MAVNSIISKISDLNEPLYQEELPNILVTGDQNGDRFDITVVRGSEKVNVASAGVTGYFIRIKSGTKIEDAPTVVIIGSASDNIVSVTLPESCYVDSGRFSLVIKAAIGNERHAVYACSGVILRSSTNEIIDPGHEIPDLDELLAKIAQLESATTAANEATTKANTAAKGADTAASSANAAASAANTAKTNAQNAADAANAAASAANTAKSNADKATTAANDAASAANTAKTNADAATKTANDAAESANDAADTANASAAAADTATSNANTATNAANAAAKSIDDMTVSGRDTAPGGAVTVTKSTVDGHIHLSFTIPRGHDGPQGVQGIPGKVQSVWGVTSDETGDARPEIGGTNLLTGTDGRHILQTAFSGTWEDGSWSRFGSAVNTFTVEPANGAFGLGVQRYFSITALSTGVAFGISQIKIPFKAGETFTFSVDAATDASAIDFVFCDDPYYAVSTTSPTVKAINKDGYVRYVFSYTIKPEDVANGTGMFAIKTDRLSGGTYLHIARIKMERGVIPTDWSPSPADVSDNVPISITTATNLDDLKLTENRIDRYAALTTNHADLVTGLPGSNTGAFTLTLECPYKSGSNYVTRQTLVYAFDTSKMYVRTYEKTKDAWGPWYVFKGEEVT